MPEYDVIRYIKPDGKFPVGTVMDVREIKLVKQPSQHRKKRMPCNVKTGDPISWGKGDMRTDLFRITRETMTTENGKAAWAASEAHKGEEQAILEQELQQKMWFRELIAKAALDEGLARRLKDEVDG